MRPITVTSRRTCRRFNQLSAQANIKWSRIKSNGKLQYIFGVVHGMQQPVSHFFYFGCSNFFCFHFSNACMPNALESNRKEKSKLLCVLCKPKQSREKNNDRKWNGMNVCYSLDSSSRRIRCDSSVLHSKFCVNECASRNRSVGQWLRAFVKEKWYTKHGAHALNHAARSINLCFIHIPDARSWILNVEHSRRKHSLIWSKADSHTHFDI